MQKKTRKLVKPRVLETAAWVVESPLGPLTLIATKEGLCEIRFEDGGYDDDVSRILDRTHPILVQAAQELSEFWQRQRTVFTVPLDYLQRGTPFQQSVWKTLEQIPFGALQSYGDIARRIEIPGAMRAVGNANGRNPLPIIVPCHRVIAAGGKLGGYSSGIERKIWLLRFEQSLA